MVHLSLIDGGSPSKLCLPFKKCFKRAPYQMDTLEKSRGFRGGSIRRVRLLFLFKGTKFPKNDFSVQRAGKQLLLHSVAAIVPAIQTTDTLTRSALFVPLLIQDIGAGQMSIVYPDKQYLGVSGRVPRCRGDKSIMLRQLRLYYRPAHTEEGCCSARPSFTGFRWSNGIMSISRMNRMAFGISRGNKLL